VLEPGTLGDDAEHVATADDLSHPATRLEVPEALRIQRGSLASGREEVALERRHPVQGSSHAIEHRAEQPRAQLCLQRAAGPLDRLADGESCRLFEHLDGGGVPFDPDHLSQQSPMPHPHPLVE